jgi:LytS/YehU family sensor histidine kinase
VSRELEYINNYIELENIRHSDRLDVSVNVYNSLDGFMISPLLILPLIENCYKHGVSNDTENSWIRIDLSVQADWLTVKIENSKSEPISNVTNGKNGIGLENVRKRLEILYPARHEFKSLSEEHSYLTILKIKNLVVEDAMPHSG